MYWILKQYKGDIGMKKLLSVILALSMILSLVGTVSAAPEAQMLESTSIVNVTGKVNDGAFVTLMLLEEDDTIKHIQEVKTEADGSYRAKFRFTESIDGLKLQVRQGTEDVTDSVISAVSEKEAVSYELSVVNSSGTYVEAQIENYFNVPNKAYSIIVAYYDSNNSLHKVIVNDKKIENDLNSFSEIFEIPANTDKIKVFMWDSVKTMIPLAKEVTGKKNETIRVLTIGHSYAADSHAYLSEIAKHDGVNMELRLAQISSSSFKTHWTAWTATTEEGRKKYTENGEKVDISHFLEDGTVYDYIVVFSRAALLDDLPAYMENMEDVVKYIRERQPTAEILMHQNWSNEKGSPRESFVNNYHGDQVFMAEQSEKAVIAACEALATVKTDSGLPISLDGKPLRYIPTSAAFTIARQSELFDTTYTLGVTWDETYKYWAPELIDESKVISLHRDSYHCSRRHGRYLAGLVWYRCLTGNSVLNNTYTQKTYPITEEGRKIINAAAQKAVDDSGLWN